MVNGVYITGMAVHYAGYQILVSFKDRVRMYFILMDKLKTVKETVLKACKNIQVFKH